MSLPNLGYVAVTVELAEQDTNYNLYDLVAEVEPNAPPTAREVTIQSSSENASDAIIRIGDASMDESRCGYELEAGEGRTYRAESQSVSLTNKYVRGSADELLLNVEIETR